MRKEYKAMVVGVPKEVKTYEFRVALTPGGVESLTSRGHKVLVESGAGEGSGITDDEYTAAGARTVSAEEAWSAELVVKVKEPIAEEYQFLRSDLILFTYLHLAAMEELTRTLMLTGTTTIAYETVQARDGSLPLLVPMSEVAGRMAAQIGAAYLEKPRGGRGILLSGVPGVAPGSVVILGGGTVGTNAAKMAMGMGAQVTLLDVNHKRLQYLDDAFGGRLITVTSTEANIKKAVQFADVLIGAVLIPGAKAPLLVTRDMVSGMKEGAVVVDLSVDQGGCVETSRPTTHPDPTYVVDGVTHYCVTNMPGAVPRTSTFALTNKTLPHILEIAGNGMQALRENPGLLQGLNVYRGNLTHEGVAKAFDLDWIPVEQALRVPANTGFPF
jgi:alanine dehydrogenase